MHNYWIKGSIQWHPNPQQNKLFNSKSQKIKLNIAALTFLVIKDVGWHKTQGSRSTVDLNQPGNLKKLKGHLAYDYLQCKVCEELADLF